MLKIKFSHQYYKLQNQGRKARLIAAIPYRIDENTPRDFLAYDTWYYMDGHYALRPGDYVLLLFLGANGVFTTIRPRVGKYGDKLEYYSKHIGMIFEIVITQEGEHGV